MDSFDATTAQCGLAPFEHAMAVPAADPRQPARAVPRDPVPLSERLWGIRWPELLPHTLDHETAVISSTFEQAQGFIDAHYAAIFEDMGEGRFSRPSEAALKARYYRATGDFFEFKQGGRTVALLIGTPGDWSTYYIRSTAAVRESQGKRLIQRFLPFLFAVLKAAGVERVDAHTSPTNMALLHLLLRLRFNPSGTVLSDRWGALLQFTRFLDEQAERVFIDQFCMGIHYQFKSHPGSLGARVSGGKS
jgi:hypothetical protein